MTALLVWITSSAFALESYHALSKTPCPPFCLGILSQDATIVPPDYFRRAAIEITPTPLEWFEITLTTHAGEVELTVQGEYLDPRSGVIDERAGTVTWVVWIRDTNNFTIEAYNPSRTVPAEYEVVGEVQLRVE
jgi:hypothetical protein